jgi:hypothetical protein
LLAVECGQSQKRLVQRDDVDVLGISGRVVIGERNQLPPGASLGGMLRAGVVDENPPHDLRGDAIELRTIPPLYAPLIDEPKVRFMNERRWLQRVSGELVSKVSRRDPPQFFINLRHQLGERLIVALTPGDQQLSDVGWRGVVRGHWTGPPG